MRGLEPLKPLEGLKPVRAKMDRMPLIPRGPERFRAATGPAEQVGGPGLPPDGFVISSTSATEWPPYWACCVIFGEPTLAEHRNPPFVGDHGFWSYQKHVDGGRTKATSGDFVFYPSHYCLEGIVMRVQTEWHHIFSPTHVQEFDRAQRAGVEKKYRVIDIYDYLWLWDTSGAAVIKYVKMALAGIEPANLPNTVRHARRSRQR